MKKGLAKNHFIRLCFSIAKELGMTFGEVLRKMTYVEIQAWSAYFTILNEDLKKEISKQ